jgi:hypothetical protein
VQIEAAVFGKGKLRAEGRADLLAEPVPHLNETIALKMSISLTSNRSSSVTTSPCARAVSAYGNVEYGAKTERIDVTELRKMPTSTISTN